MASTVILPRNLRLYAFDLMSVLGVDSNNLQQLQGNPAVYGNVSAHVRAGRMFTTGERVRTVFELVASEDRGTFQAVLRNSLVGDAARDAARAGIEAKLLEKEIKVAETMLLKPIPFDSGDSWNVVILASIPLGVLGNTVAYEYTLSKTEYEQFESAWKKYDAVGWQAMVAALGD
jgi:hypothetical protein